MNGEENEMLVDKEETESLTDAPSTLKNGEAENKMTGNGETAADAMENGQTGLEEGEEQYNAFVDEAPAYIIVSDQEGGIPIELPLEADHALLVKTLQIEYTGAMGIKYKNPDTDIYRVIAPKEDGKLLPPPGGWGSHYFIACCPRALDDRPWMNETVKPSTPSVTQQQKRPLPSSASNLEPPAKRANLPAGLSDVNSTPVGTGQGPPSKGPGPVPGPSFDFCKICNVELNSQVQADAHYKGKKHLEKMAGAGRGRGGPARGGGPPRGRGTPPRGFGGGLSPRGGAPLMIRRGGVPMGPGPRGGPPGRGFPQRGLPRGRGGQMERGGMYPVRGGRSNMVGLLDSNSGYQSFSQTARQMFEKNDFTNDGPSFHFSGRGGRKVGGNYAPNSSAPYGGH